MEIRPDQIKFAPPEVQAQYTEEQEQQNPVKEEKVPADSNSEEKEADNSAADSEKKPAISFYQKMAERTQFHLPDFDTGKLAEFAKTIIDATKKAVPDLARVWNSSLLQDLQRGREDKLAQKLSAKENELNELDRKHEDFQRRMTLVAEKIGAVDPAVTAEIEKENRKFEQARQNLLKEKEQATNKLGDHLQRFSGFETKRDNLLDTYVSNIESRLTTVDQEISQQEQKIEDAEKEMASLREVIDNSSAKILEFEQIIASSEYASERKAYEQEINRLRKLIVEKADQYNQQEQVRDRLADALISCEHKHDLLRQKIDEVRVVKKTEGGNVQSEAGQDRPKSLFDQSVERPYSLSGNQEEHTETTTEKSAEIQKQIEKAVQLWNKKNGIRLMLDKSIVLQMLNESSGDSEPDAAKTFEKILVLYHRGVVRKKIKGKSVFGSEGELRRELKKFSKEI